MSFKYVVFVPGHELLPNAHIRHSAEGAKPHFYAIDEGHTAHPDWVRCVLHWSDGDIEITRLDHRTPDLGDHVKGLLDEVAVLEHTSGKHGRDAIMERLGSSRNILVLSAPEELGERIAHVARTCAKESGGLLWHKQVIEDSNGRKLLSSDPETDVDAGWEDTEFALTRRERSEERIRALGLEPISLPTIDCDETALIRQPWEAARRANALAAVAARAEGMEAQKAIQFLQGWQIWDAASPQEQAFLMTTAPTEVERIRHLWRYEGLWVMLWALGLVEPLGDPTAICDVRRAVRIVTGTATDVFISHSVLRPVSQILDEADFAYRCYRSLKSPDPSERGVHPGVAKERFIAFNWLRSYHHASWDQLGAESDAIEVKEEMTPA